MLPKEMAQQQGRVGTRGNRDPLARPAADADPETVMRWLLEVNHAQMDQLREQVQKQGQAMDNMVTHITALTTTHGDSVTEINTHLKAMTDKLIHPRRDRRRHRRSQSTERDSQKNENKPSHIQRQERRETRSLHSKSKRLDGCYRSDKRRR